jgi:SnoaL-like domain
MKIRFFCLCLFLVIPLYAQQTTSVNNLNVLVVEKSLNDFSTALATADTLLLKHLTGPNFVLLEEGRTFDYQAMILSIQQVFATGAKMKRVPVDFHTEIRGSVAWSNYSVTGEFASNQGKIVFSLLETAVLEKVGEQWLIVQMTTIPAANK